MPRVQLSAENKRTSQYEYPKLFLDRGERARILVIEPEPMVEYVHDLRAIQVVNGRVVMETVQRYGKDEEAPKYDFVGRPLCLGDLNVLDAKGADPDGCPACAASVESSAVEGPKRRFAMHVVQYTTAGGSFNVAEPFSAKLVVWAYTDRIFNQLADFAAPESQGGWGDLKKHDLLLGPCENKKFQRFDINVAPNAAWLKDDSRKSYIKELYQSNQAQDLSVLIGRRVTAEQMREDLQRVLDRYRAAYGGTDVDQLTATAEIESMDLDTLLDDAPTVVEDTEVEDTKAGEVIELDELFKDV